MQEIFYFLLTKSKTQARTNKKHSPSAKKKLCLIFLYKNIISYQDKIIYIFWTKHEKPTIPSNSGSIGSDLTCLYFSITRYSWSSKIHESEYCGSVKRCVPIKELKTKSWTNYLLSFFISLKIFLAMVVPSKSK